MDHREVGNKNNARQRDSDTERDRLKTWHICVLFVVWFLLFLQAMDGTESTNKWIDSTNEWIDSTSAYTLDEQLLVLFSQVHDLVG
jgi:hypothetical protein